MSNDCKGIFGNVFGHSFKEYLIKPKVCEGPIEYFTQLTGSSEDYEKYLESKTEIYEIRCRRCGVKTFEGLKKHAHLNEYTDEELKKELQSIESKDALYLSCICAEILRRELHIKRE